MNLILASSFPGLPVTDTKGKQLGTITGTLIDMDDGVLVGLTVKKSLITPQHFIHFEDIEDMYHSHIQVKKQEYVVPLKDEPRAQKIEKKGFRLIGLRVVTKSGKKIGRLDDMAISLNMGAVVRFYVKSLFMNRIIDRDNVIEVSKKKIVVEDDMTYAKQDRIRLPKILNNKPIESISSTELAD